MFANVVRNSFCFRNGPLFKAGFVFRRQLSIASTHTNFPATLYRFQPRRSSGLSDFKQSDDYEDGLELSEDGLVRTNVSGDRLC